MGNGSKEEQRGRSLCFTKSSLLTDTRNSFVLLDKQVRHSAFSKAIQSSSTSYHLNGEYCWSASAYLIAWSLNIKHIDAWKVLNGDLSMIVMISLGVLFVTAPVCIQQITPTTDLSHGVTVQSQVGIVVSSISMRRNEAVLCGSALWVSEEV